jgi:hypothetical protein
MSSFFKNIWADLVEKRLWPLALVLVLALVAVPTLLAKGSAEEPVGPDPTAAGAAAPATGAQSEVIALDVSGASGPRNGATGRNPFEQLFVPKPKPAADAAAPGTDQGNPGKAGGGESGSTGTGEGKTAPAPEPKKTKTTYKVNLRFGEAGAMKSINDIARLAPLPSAANPFFVFLGVKDRGETLVFLVSSDAKATGDGTCKPSASQCETIELKAGETEFFDVSTDEGIRQYQLDVIAIRKVTTVSTGAAKQANARVSQAGAELLRAAGSDGLALGAYRWSPGLGELLPVQP